MTRTERQRRKRRRKIQRACAWTVLIVFELLIAAAPMTITAAILIPLVYAQRGYYGVGSEWILIISVFCVAYSTIHRKICDRIFEEG